MRSFPLWAVSLFPSPPERVYMGIYVRMMRPILWELRIFL